MNLAGRKILFIFFCFLFPLIGMSSPITGFIKGDGRFYAMEDDSLAFVKKQLLFNAFKDIISKELNNEGLNSNFFWEKFDEKFEEHFEPTKKALSEKYGIENEDVNPKEKEKYKKALRLKRFTQKGDFGGIKSAIHSYSIKRMTRSTQIANSRYIQINAKLNKKKLNALYIKLTNNGNFKIFKNLYISADFSLENMTWADAGVDVKDDFISVVKDHWKKWLGKSLSDSVENFVLMDAGQEKSVKDYLRIPTEGAQIEENLKNSLWLKFNVIIAKKGEDIFLRKREFNFSLTFLLIEIEKNSLLSHFDFNSQPQKYDFINSHELSSNLASMVYRIPLDKFRDFKKNISSLPTNSHSLFLTVKNIGSIQELFEFNEFLAEKGVSLQVFTQIKSLSGKNARIGVTYQGNHQEMTDFLKSLNSLDFKKNKSILLPEIENPYSIMLVNKESSLEVFDGTQKSDATLKRIKKDETQSKKIIINMDVEPKA